MDIPWLGSSVGAVGARGCALVNWTPASWAITSATRFATSEIPPL